MRFIGSASQSIRGALSSATSRHTSATSHRPETQLSVYGVGGITDTGMWDLCHYIGYLTETKENKV